MALCALLVRTTDTLARCCCWRPSSCTRSTRQWQAAESFKRRGTLKIFGGIELSRRPKELPNHAQAQ